MAQSSERNQLPTAHVVHSLRGRTRLRVPSQKGNREFFVAIEQILGADQQVAYIATNPKTGSILIHHRNELVELDHFVRSRGLFTVQREMPSPERALSGAALHLDRLDRVLRRNTHGAFDLDELLFVGLVGAALVQMVRGRVLAPASTLLSYAATILAIHRAKRNNTG